MTKNCGFAMRFFTRALALPPEPERDNQRDELNQKMATLSLWMKRSMAEARFMR